MNVIRFPVERTRLPGESVESHTNRLSAFNDYADFLSKMGMGPEKAAAVIHEIAKVIDEFEEIEADERI